jgi:hypothetical protein
MSLMSASISNPLFQEAGKKAVFSAVQAEEGDNELFNPNAPLRGDRAILDVDDNELAQIRKWSRIMRISMLIIATLIMATAYANIGSTSVQLSDGFLAMYLFFFSVLLCCFELAIKRAAVVIVQNFGFMYSTIGRMCFLSFVAIVCFNLSTLGKAVFALLLAYGCLNAYVNFKHPKYSQYLRIMHYYSTVKAGKQSTVETV